MGLFDRARKLAEEHADKVEDAIDKVADVVDDKTGGKYGAKIDKGAAAAKDFVDGDGEHVTVDGDGEHVTVDGDGDGEAAGGVPPPTVPGPPSSPAP